MTKVFSAHAVSVDGYITGRDPGPGRGLGDGTTWSSARRPVAGDGAIYPVQFFAGARELLAEDAISVGPFDGKAGVPGGGIPPPA